METPKLTYPTPQAGQHLMVETRPDKLQKWLKSLPYGDMTRAVPEVAQAIASINRTEMSVNHRAELVSLFDKTYALISDYYRPKIIQRPLGQQDASREEMDKLQLLSREISFGYKMIVDDLMHKTRLWGKPKNLARSINLAMHYLGFILMEHYETYSPIPVYIWRELNSLFAYAEHHNYINTNTVGENYFHCTPTILHTYLRICLIALVNPYHLERGDHWHLYKYLASWGNLAKISEDPDEFQKRNCFIIDVTSSNKPQFGVNELEDPEDPRLRLLLTSELTSKLIQQLETLKSHNLLPDPGFFSGIKRSRANKLLQRMAAHWDYRIERSAPRYPLITRIDLVWGLNNIHRVFSHQTVLSTINSEKESEKSLHILLGKSHPYTVRWNAVNVSDGGISLTQPELSIENLRIGELAAMREYVDGKPGKKWRLAICRWLHGDERRGTHLGLQFVKGNTEPAIVKARKGNLIETAGLPCIIITGEEIHGLYNPTLLVPKGLYRDGRELIVETEKEAVHIRARMKVESTSTVERFFYQGYAPETEEEINPHEIHVEELPAEKMNQDEMINWDLPKNSANNENSNTENPLNITPSQKR